MNTAIDAFLQYWRVFTPKGARFVHPEDAGSTHLDDFELTLLPIPFIGDLCNAECVILMLNPGLDDEDSAWEKKSTFRSALEGNLTQSFPIDAHPNFYLDPAFAQHAGAGYWAKSRRLTGRRDSQKLRSVIEAVALRDGVSEAAAQRHVARKVAVLQLCPYHSRVLHRRAALSSLASVTRARSFAHALIREKSKLLIAARSVAEWGLTGPHDTDHLVVYAPAQGASASLTVGSKGGQAMLKRLSRVNA